MDDLIINLVGSWTFMALFFIWVMMWIKFARFDPYPYIFLNFIISLIAMFISLVILIESNHLHSKMDFINHVVKARTNRSHQSS